MKSEEVNDILLARYARYLIAQNGDRSEKISGLRPYAGGWNRFSTKISELRPYLP